MNAVAMQRPPPFQKENPVVWFGLLEAAMNLSKLTNDVTKYYYVISSLDPSTANLIADIIMSPPPVDKYKTVNVRLMKLFGQSEKTRAQESLRTCRMGDEKPSHFLQRLRGLAGSNMPDSVLKSIFLEQVPSSLHDILVASENPDLNKLAALADRVTEYWLARVCSMERNNMAEFQVPQVASLEQHRVATPAPQNSMAARDDHVTTLLIQQIAELTREVGALKVQNAQHHSRPRWRGRSPSNAGRSPARSRSRSSERNNGACFYHRRFGANANRCIIPCTWTTASIGNSSNSTSEN